MSEKKPKNRGKFNKGRHGGSRSFVQSEEEMRQRAQIEKERAIRRKARRGDSDEEDGDFEEGESGDDEVEFKDDDAGEDQQLADRARVAIGLGGEVIHVPGAQDLPPKPKKASGVAGLIQVENPNMAKPQDKVIKAKDMKDNFEQKLSRREREAIEKAQAEAEYRRRHLAGQTEEAKRDLARLAEVKRRREEAAKRKQEEEEAEKQRKAMAGQKADDDSDDELDSIKVKKMNPTELKNALKKKDLSTQGNKKELMQRLLDSLK